jgi:hypothetical protein
MIDIEDGDRLRLRELPERRPDPLLLERVRALAHARLAARRRSLSARAAEALLSVLVAGTAVLYVGWALRFASALYQ